MPVTFNLYYTGQNGSAKKFVNDMISSGTVEKIRAEKGNLRYDYFISVDNPETVLLIDSWESQEALDIHHASDMMQTIFALREKYDLHMKVQRFITADDISDANSNFLRK